MNLKNLIKKGIVFGPASIVAGHVVDAAKKKKKSKQTLAQSMKESIKETITEDLPITSNLYQMGRMDGKAQGTAEQAARDERKFESMHQKHENERQEWHSIDKEKDEIIKELLQEE